MTKIMHILKKGKSEMWLFCVLYKIYSIIFYNNILKILKQLKTNYLLTLLLTLLNVRLIKKNY